ncbi:MAG: S9 family peptidase [Bacteroidales bacterium]|nr:S9 family peptidase [Bacteroidales bacterium]
MRKLFHILLLLTLMMPVSRAGDDFVNPVKSPDGKWTAYTSGNDLYVRSLDGSRCVRCTDDGSGLILNGYASWVYYEEIFGRSSNYRAFWWSPDSKKIAFYRFDNTDVPLFPIYRISGYDGNLLETRYPKAGDRNPEVRIGIFDLESGKTTWACFDSGEERYFGTPFWGVDSSELFVQSMPRAQNQLDLHSVSVGDGSLKKVYHEEYPTWIDWMSGMLFDSKGLYMARDFEDGWYQIYYLSYDGKVFRKLTDGCNTMMRLLALDAGKGDVYFEARRESDVRTGLYRLGKSGKVKSLTPQQYSAKNIRISEDFRSFSAEYSNSSTPVLYCSASMSSAPRYRIDSTSAPQNFDIGKTPHREILYIDIDGLKVPGSIMYPENFDAGRKYPVVMEIYGGPGTSYVRDEWRTASPYLRWFYENGYIYVTVDSRVSGHNGRSGTDLSFRDFVTVPVYDFVKWAEYLESLPYVGAIGVEGFSFGGTNAAMLVMTHPEHFCCGIAGGGVYDWHLYDSHYTERYMLPPYLNVEGYEKACVLNYVKFYDPSKSYLKLTHGTGDDNVHFQNTLELVSALQQEGKQFELMIYPNGMHGYRGAQNAHDNTANQIFWESHLKPKTN